jgi:hypothetical protein
LPLNWLLHVHKEKINSDFLFFEENAKLKLTAIGQRLTEFEISKKEVDFFVLDNSLLQPTYQAIHRHLELSTIWFDVADGDVVVAHDDESNGYFSSVFAEFYKVSRFFSL